MAAQKDNEERYIDLLEKSVLFTERQAQVSIDLKDVLKTLVANQKEANDRFIFHCQTEETILKTVGEIKSELMEWIVTIVKKGVKVILVLALLLLLSLGGGGLLTSLFKLLPHIGGV